MTAVNYFAELSHGPVVDNLILWGGVALLMAVTTVGYIRRRHEPTNTNQHEIPSSSEDVYRKDFDLPQS